MKRNGDSTNPCRSPTPTVKGRDLTFPTWTQTYEQKYSDLTITHRRPSTPTPATLPKAFHKEPGYMLSRGRQSMIRCLWYTPKIFQNFAGGWNVVCGATAVTKTALDISWVEFIWRKLRISKTSTIQLWVNYFAVSFFIALQNVNVNLKIPKKHRRPHKRPSRATCSPRAACLRSLL